MTDRRNFTTADCSIWLKQMAVGVTESMNARYFNESWEPTSIVKHEDNIERDLKMHISILAISIGLWLMYWIQSFHLKQKIGYSHLILTLWMILQIPPIIPIK